MEIHKMMEPIETQNTESDGIIYDENVYLLDANDTKGTVFYWHQNC